VKNITSSCLKILFEEHLNIPVSKKGFWGMEKLLTIESFSQNNSIVFSPEIHAPVEFL
jgi:hypothetical protein